MPISRSNTVGLRLLLGPVVLVATWLALTPQPVPLPLPEVALADKWAHLATYLLLAFMVDASWPERGFGPSKWGSLLVYGVVIELLQSQIPNRVFSFGDLAANAAGVGLYAFVILRVLRERGIR